MALDFSKVLSRHSPLQTEENNDNISFRIACKPIRTGRFRNGTLDQCFSTGVPRGCFKLRLIAVESVMITATYY